MKKSLSKILARMAKDGDIETVAEIIEEMIEPEAAAEAEAAAAAETVAEAVETVAEEPAAVVETPEGATIVVDEATLGDIISRLDQLISLLTPAPAADDDPAGDPVEEIAEAVEEAIEAAEAAEEEAILPDEDLAEGLAPEEVAEIVGEILEPVAAEAVSEVLDPLEDECDPEEQEVLSTGDALRNALNHYQHKLARMPEKKRRRVCSDLAARLGRPAGRRGTDAGAYAAMGTMQRKPARGNPADLGKCIMAKRNVNHKKH